MAHSLKRVLFWLSGAGTETLEQCPNWEQRKYVAFGATVLVPCAFAFIACSYALPTLVDDPLIIYPVATVWALIILTMTAPPRRIPPLPVQVSETLPILLNSRPFVVPTLPVSSKTPRNHPDSH